MSQFALSMASEALEVVRRPRPADAVGAALRGAFATPPLPEDLARLLRQLDNAN